MTAIQITEELLADDIGMFANNKSDLQNNLDVWKKELKYYKMKINESKFKVMCINNST